MADKVRFSKGVTINTGNYQSVRLDLDLEMEVEPGETLTIVYGRAKEWVELQLAKEEKQIREAR